MAFQNVKEKGHWFGSNQLNAKKKEAGSRERKLKDRWPDSNGLNLMGGIRFIYSYDFGFQQATCGDFVPYKKRTKLFLYFGFKPPAKI